MSDGARGSSGAEYGCLLAGRVEAGVLLERAVEACQVRVVANQVAAMVHDRVDGSDRLSAFVESVEQRDDGLFIRDRDVCAVDVVPANGVDASF